MLASCMHASFDPWRACIDLLSEGPQKNSEVGEWVGSRSEVPL